MTRLLIAAPPKTGNVWVERLFALGFGLQWLRTAPSYAYWGGRDLDGLHAFLESGAFPAKSICHQHFWPSPELDRIAVERGIGLITTLRNPYDQFVSWYFYVQAFAPAFRAVDDPAVRAIGRPIGDPVVLDLLATEFGTLLDQGVAWVESGGSFVVRYEDLHADPRAVLAAARSALGFEYAMPPEAAIAASERKAMRALGPDLASHIREGRSEGWRQHLTEAHLEVFRARHARRVAALGYELR